jgi:hypothetical protein
MGHSAVVEMLVTFGNHQYPKTIEDARIPTIFWQPYQIGSVGPGRLTLQGYSNEQMLALRQVMEKHGPLNAVIFISIDGHVDTTHCRISPYYDTIEFTNEDRGQQFSVLTTKHTYFRLRHFKFASRIILPYHEATNAIHATSDIALGVDKPERTHPYFTREPGLTKDQFDQYINGRWERDGGK